jgi:hypothetical protein
VQVKVVEGAPVVWGVAAVAHAGNQASDPVAGVEEFPPPELVTDRTGPAAALDDHPLLPRRKRVAAEADASVLDPSAVEASALAAPLHRPLVRGKNPGDYLTFSSTPRYCVTDRSLKVLAGMRNL